MTKEIKDNLENISYAINNYIRTVASELDLLHNFDQYIDYKIEVTQSTKLVSVNIIPLTSQGEVVIEQIILYSNKEKEQSKTKRQKKSRLNFEE